MTNAQHSTSGTPGYGNYNGRLSFNYWEETDIKILNTNEEPHIAGRRREYACVCGD